MRVRLRKLHVDGQEFTWRADIRSAAAGPDGRRHRCIRVRAWGAGKNGRALQVDLAQRPRPVDDEDETYPFPHADDIRTLVKYALSKGWQPTALGGTFLITATAELTLSDLAVTDLLWTSDQRV